MPRLLILCEYGSLNGGERSMLSTLDGVIRAGYEVTVAAPSAGPLADELRSRGIEVVSFESNDPGGARLTLPERRRRLAEVIQPRRPALLHANSLAMGRLSGPVAAELAVSSISHIRDIIALSAQAVADLNRHMRLLAVSESARQFHVSQGVAAEKIAVLYNGVDTEEFRPRRPTGYLHDELGLPRDWPLLGTIGQISLRKGQDVLLAALSLVAARHPSPFACVVIGERYSDKAESREFEELLHSAARDGPLAGRLFFLGTRGDVARILPELTLLVHPARQEPLGRVLLEAAACGTAIVATNVGGTCEIFPSAADAARIVPRDDASSLARAIEELLGDSNRRSRMGTAARARVEAMFTIEQATAGLLRYYEAAGLA